MKSSTCPSSTDGSDGGGPSIAHRRDSYLERMNESILLYQRIKPGRGNVRGKYALIRRQMPRFEMGFPV
jgi:hypothetical protein